MVQTLQKFKCRPEVQKVRDYRDIQKSVNLLFCILEEYGRLGKNLAELKKQESS
ncbi:MAG: hypothetical protein IH843_04820 [Thaumarchaeota archaeon]|nr:hypothetical protein [Nitrososphaerota archaeon]